MKVLTPILLVIVLVMAGYLYSQHAKKTTCEGRALAAAVDEYPIDSNPSAAVRQSLQQDYKVRYMHVCMNQ